MCAETYACSHRPLYGWAADQDLDLNLDVDLDLALNFLSYCSWRRGFSRFLMRGGGAAEVTPERGGQDIMEGTRILLHGCGGRPQV